jgi:hypothetical protein
MSEKNFERNSRLVDLWNDGVTGSKISELLGMPTNSVYRTVNELRKIGFTLRINPVYAAAQRKRRSGEVKLKAPGKAKTPKPRPAASPDLSDTPPRPKVVMRELTETPEGLLREKLYRLKERSCRWIEGNTPPYDFPCQELTVIGSSYCATHGRRIFNGKT